ncbi:hypothetical protein DF147_36140, partial [Burkholderia cenocepacia]
MAVASRIPRLPRLGRTCPDLAAGLLFEPDERKAVLESLTQVIHESRADDGGSQEEKRDMS